MLPRVSREEAEAKPEQSLRFNFSLNQSYGSRLRGLLNVSNTNAEFYATGSSGQGEKRYADGLAGGQEHLIQLTLARRASAGNRLLNGPDLAGRRAEPRLFYTSAGRCS